MKSVTLNGSIIFLNISFYPLIIDWEDVFPPFDRETLKNNAESTEVEISTERSVFLCLGGHAIAGPDARATHGGGAHPPMVDVGRRRRWLRLRTTSVVVVVVAWLVPTAAGHRPSLLRRSPQGAHCGHHVPAALAARPAAFGRRVGVLLQHSPLPARRPTLGAQRGRRASKPIILGKSSQNSVTFQSVLVVGF